MPLCTEIAANGEVAIDTARLKTYLQTVLAEGVSPAGSGRGATTGVNPEAWIDSIREVGACFDWHVMPAKNQVHT